MKFVDVKNDIAFRKIFGNENRKETLISFLNAILDFSDQQRIAAVSILNPYQLPKLRGGKVTIIDIKATDQAGRTYIVEMQVGDINGFAKRVLYYSSKSYSDQIKRADFYRKLQPVIFIGILDFVQTENQHYISRSQIRDVETGEQTIKDMEFNFIELPKFNKTLQDLSTLTEKWVYFIKNAENLEVLPENINDEGLKSAYEEANIQTWTQEELDAYDYTFMREEDERARMDKAIQNAIQNATQKGAAEERAKAEQEKEEMKRKAEQEKEALKTKAEQEKEEMILEMNEGGFGIEQIAKIAKKSVSEIQAIIAKYKS
jgi:predicted transposase/invertase (TIGR01784 family)